MKFGNYFLILLILLGLAPVSSYAGVSGVTLGFRYKNDSSVKQRVYYYRQTGASNKAYSWYSATQRKNALNIIWTNDGGIRSVDVNPGQTVTYTGTMPRLAREDEIPSWTAFVDGVAYVFNRAEDLEAPNRAPSISISAPGSVNSGQNYTVSATGTDPDNNLTRVNLYKNGGMFTNWSGGNSGSRSVSRSTSDGGPQTIQYYAEAYDAKGIGVATSKNVRINAPAPPPNSAPSISINAPSSVNNGARYTVSATGRDSNGNLTEVTLYKNGTAFASRGGNLGSSYTVSNPTSDSGPATITYSAVARDSSGANRTTSKTVRINAPAAPANSAPSISINAPSSVNNGARYTVSATGTDSNGNLTEVTLYKNGTAFASHGGNLGSSYTVGNPTSDSGPATITYSAVARDSSGANRTTSKTVRINAPAAPTSYSLNIEAGTHISASLNWGGRHYDTKNGTITISGLTSGTVISDIRSGPNSGYVFDKWVKSSGQGNFTSSGQTAAFRMGNGNATIKVFAKTAPAPTYNLTVRANSGGTASGSINGLTANTTTPISANPDSSHNFAGWVHNSGSGNISNTKAKSTSFTMGNSNATVTATFSAKAVSQAAISSQDATINIGESFTPRIIQGNPKSSATAQYSINGGAWTSISKPFNPPSTGNYPFRVRRPGDGTYSTVTSSSYTLHVTQRNQTAIASQNATITYGESFTPTITQSDPTSSKGVEYRIGNGSWVSISIPFTPGSAGDYTFYVRRPGDATYSSTQAGPYTLHVNKADQPAVSSKGGKVQKGDPFTIIAMGGHPSAGAYKYRWVSPSTSGWMNAPATVYKDEGTYRFEVMREGNANYNPVYSVAYTLQVVAPIQTTIDAVTNPHNDYRYWFERSETESKNFERLP